jgi:hypothetical protein
MAHPLAAPSVRLIGLLAQGQAVPCEAMVRAVPLPIGDHVVLGFLPAGDDAR